MDIILHFLYQILKPSSILLNIYSRACATRLDFCRSKGSFMEFQCFQHISIFLVLSLENLRKFPYFPKKKVESVFRYLISFQISLYSSVIYGLFKLLHGSGKVHLYNFFKLSIYMNSSWFQTSVNIFSIQNKNTKKIFGASLEILSIRSLPWGHVRSLKKIGPDRFNPFWCLSVTSKHTNRQTISKYIYIDQFSWFWNSWSISKIQSYTLFN